MFLQLSSSLRSKEEIASNSGGSTADIDHGDTQSSSAIDCIEIISPTHWRSFDTPVSSLQSIFVSIHFEIEYNYDHNNKAVLQVVLNLPRSLFCINISWDMISFQIKSVIVDHHSYCHTLFVLAQALSSVHS